jgi:hypothetical protein
LAKETIYVWIMEKVVVDKDVITYVFKISNASWKITKIGRQTNYRSYVSSITLFGAYINKE